MLQTMTSIMQELNYICCAKKRDDYARVRAQVCEPRPILPVYWVMMLSRICFS